MATMYSATRPLMPLHKDGPRLQSPGYLLAWLRHRSAVRPRREIAACASAGKQARATQAATMHPPTRPGVPHVKRRRAPAISTLSAFAAAAQTRPCATGMLHGGGEGKGGLPHPRAAMGAWPRQQRPALCQVIAPGPCRHPAPSAATGCATAPGTRCTCISRESSPGHIDGDDVFCH